MNILNIFLVSFWLISKSFINGQGPLYIYQCMRPADPTAELILQNFFEQPGIDILHINNRQMQVAIPARYIPAFSKLGISANGTDLLERELLSASSSEGSSIGIGRRSSDFPVFDEAVGGGIDARMADPFNGFLPYDSIIEYLQNLERNFPSRIQLVGMERTVNNRTIYAVIIKSGIVHNTAVFIDGGAIARQWITIAAALYIIKEVGANIHSHPELNNIDWIIMPVVNPDGYEYSYRNKQVRMWTKNRNCPQDCGYKGTCGVNIDRNFPFYFGGAGVSYNPCSNMYLGPMPLSEPETRCVLTSLQVNRHSLKMYVGLRCFGASILYPWGFMTQAPKDESDLQHLAQIGAEAMYLAQPNFSPNYSVGNYAKVKFQAGGTVLDYIRGVLNVKYAYVVNIRQRPSDPTGFTPNNQDILPLVKECFHGIKAMAKFVYYKYPPPKSNLRMARNKRRKKNNSASRVLPGTIVTILLITKLL